MEFCFTARLWLYAGKVSWVFATLPEEVADGVRFLQAAENRQRRGFGSVPVNVQIGDTKWKTSIFPDKASGSFLLPIKMAVRRAEGLSPDMDIQLTLTPIIDL